MTIAAPFHDPPADSIAGRNMSYLRLRHQEYNLHQYLMELEIRYWPESLVEFVQARKRMYGTCGDVISVAVADWIRCESNDA